MILRKRKLLLVASLLIIIFTYYFWVYRNRTAYGLDDYVSIAEYFDKKEEFANAIKFYKKTLALDQNNLLAHAGLAKIYFNLEKYEKSLEHFKKVYSLQPNIAKLLFKMGFIYYYKMGDLDNAIKVTQEYIKHQDDNYNAHIILQDCYFKKGDFAQALQHAKRIEEIWFTKGTAKNIDKEWDGADLSGKTILLRDNVGIGDIFCWARYAKHMKKQGAKVMLETRSFLIPILSKCPYLDGFVSRGERLPDFDCQVLVGQMPLYFVKNQEDMTLKTPYMHADSRLVTLWKKRFARDKNFKVGICWDPCVYKDKAGEVIKNKRAVPLCLFSSLAHLDNITFYSLQQVNGVGQLNSVPKHFKIKTFDQDFDKKYGSFMDTAAVMKNLDLVITADTSIAHLAGAMGVDVWVLLPLVADWRWLSDEHTTVLYPTMRLFRQKKLGDWEPVVNNVYYELRKLIS